MKTNKNNSNLKSSKKKSHPFWQFFWLTFLVVSLWYAWYSFYAPSNDITWTNDIESAQKIADNSNKNIMVFFTAEWCSPCRIMKRQVFADEEVERIINSQLTPVIIDVDNPNTKELVTYFNIGITPTTIILDSHGDVLDYAVGKIDKMKFLEMLKNVQPK